MMCSWEEVEGGQHWSERLGWHCCCSEPCPGCEHGCLVSNKSRIPVDDRKSFWCMFSESPGERSQRCLPWRVSCWSVSTAREGVY